MDFHGILGHEFVGVVEAIDRLPGASTPHSLIGKRVVGEINAACRKSDCWYCQRGMYTQCPERTTLGIVGRNGAFAEYLTLPVENLHVVPDNVSDEEAVFVEPLAANFEIFEQVHIHPTDRVVVLGDGKMGQLAARVLALSGCEVTLVGKHPGKLLLANIWYQCLFAGRCRRTDPLRSSSRRCGCGMYRIRARAGNGSTPGDEQGAFSS